jgi:hypothetical protein
MKKFLIVTLICLLAVSGFVLLNSPSQNVALDFPILFF